MSGIYETAITTQDGEEYAPTQTPEALQQCLRYA